MFYCLDGNDHICRTVWKCNATAVKIKFVEFGISGKAVVPNGIHTDIVFEITQKKRTKEALSTANV